MTYGLIRVRVVCATVSPVLSAARLCPVKISISVEHSIVMAMCLSSCGRSSSTAEVQIAAYTAGMPGLRNKWIAKCVCLSPGEQIRQRRNDTRLRDTQKFVLSLNHPLRWAEAVRREGRR